MAFWSGETLAARLPALITPYDAARIDCASYTLTLGAEAFVTTDQRLDDSADRGLKIALQPGDQCRIPPGQFAFLLTEETVTVPNTALAFISMRARWKFRGLVNVSGFHVDPGWSGKLVFSVYNAGPSPIVLSRGAEVFLIWYADLDRESASIKAPGGLLSSIPDHLVEGMAGQVFSPIALSKDVNELKEKAVEIREDIAGRHLATTVDLTELKTDFKFYKALVWTSFFLVLGVMARVFIPEALAWIMNTYHEAKSEAAGAALPLPPEASHTQDRLEPIAPTVAQPETMRATGSAAPHSINQGAQATGRKQ